MQKNNELEWAETKETGLHRWHQWVALLARWLACCACKAGWLAVWLTGWLAGWSGRLSDWLGWLAGLTGVGPLAYQEWCPTCKNQVPKIQKWSPQSLKSSIWIPQSTRSSSLQIHVSYYSCQQQVASQQPPAQMGPPAGAKPSGYPPRFLKLERATAGVSGAAGPTLLSLRSLLHTYLYKILASLLQSRCRNVT